MATPGLTHFIVTGIGVREARSTVGRDVLVRDRAGRQQVKLQILKNRRGIGYVAEPQWFDEALVFLNRDAAVDLYRRARQHAPTIGKGIWAAAIELVNSSSTLHPAWPGNQ